MTRRHEDLPHKPAAPYSDHPKAVEGREYYAAHAEDIRARQRARYDATAASARKEAWRRDPDNAAHVRAYNAAYYKKRQATLRARARKRQAALRAREDRRADS